MDKTAIKVRAAGEAVEAMVKSGMKLGLGTGSTAIPAVRRVGELLAEGALRDILAVPTSFQTIIECEKWGIPLYTLNSKEIGGSLDLTIDGADEIDPRNRCVKGGGGALLLEKIVAYASAACAIVVDETKLSPRLGLQAALPVEVVPDAQTPVSRALENTLGAAVTLRTALRKAGPVITDRGNFILDLRFAAPVDPAALETAINRLPGVVENGFFTALPPGKLFVGRSGGRVDVTTPWTKE